MAYRLTLERRLLLGSVIPILIIAGITLSALLAFQAAQQSTARVAQSRDVLAQVHALQRQESRAVLALQQGLLSGAARPEPFDQTVGEFKSEWLRLYSTMDGNAEQQQRLRSWLTRFEAWAGEVARAGDVKLSGRPPDLSVLAEDETLAAAFIRVEEQVLAARRGQSQNAISRAYWTVLLGLPLVAALMWLFGHLMVLRVRHATVDLVRAAERVTAGDLSARVPLSGADEFTLLGRQFNVMAERLHTLVEDQRHLQASLEHRVEQLVDSTTREMELLGQLSTFMEVSLDEHEAYALIATVATALLPGRGEIALLAAPGNLLDVHVTWGEWGEARHYRPEACWAVRLGTPYGMTLRQGLDPPGCTHTQAREGESVLCLPLTAQGDMLGVMTLYFPDAQVLEAATPLSQRFAERVALSLVNLKLRSSLQQQSVRDPLTGLYNRRYLEETASREAARARRHQQPLSALMIDIDHFKQVNDTFGHATGDAVLRQVGRQLQQHVRAEDVLCRYGGEEFVVLLPDCPAALAVERAEILRRAVERLAAEQGTVAVTVSIGVAVMDGVAGDNVEGLLVRADAAAYRAKATGRNRVLLHEGLALPPAT